MEHEHMGDVLKVGSPIRVADIVIALILIVVSIFGTFWNTIAFVFFSQKFVKDNNLRDKNKVYFRFIYITICTTDLIICGSVLPVIDAMIEDPGYPYFRIPVMFGNTVFCNLWGVLWEILPSFSVFLVGVLSLSRLILLVKPYFRFRLRTLCVAMAAYSIIILASKIALLATTDVMRYEPMLRYCFIISHRGMEFRDQEIMTVAVMISHLALPVIPVFLCFICSLILLLGPKYRAAHCKHAHIAQGKAASTVIIITIVYIIFNIPIIINNAFFLHGLSSQPNAKFVDLYDNVWKFYYTWPLTYIVNVAINSMINPLIYYFRMEIFKSFIDRGLRSMKIKASNRIRDNNLMI